MKKKKKEIDLKIQSGYKHHHMLYGCKIKGTPYSKGCLRNTC